MDERRPLTSEQVRGLIRDLVAVVGSYAPSWTARSDEDPGITLLEVFAWLADTLIEYQTQIAGEAALGTRRRLGVIRYHVLSETFPVVTVDGRRWEPIAAESPSAAGDGAYVVETGSDGTTTLVFGDGRAGARPPVDSSEVVATYRSGAGATRLTVTCRWPPEPGAAGVRLDRDRIAFEPPRRRRSGLVARLIDYFR